MEELVSELKNLKNRRKKRELCLKYPDLFVEEDLKKEQISYKKSLFLLLN